MRSSQRPHVKQPDFLEAMWHFISQNPGLRQADIARGMEKSKCRIHQALIVSDGMGFLYSENDRRIYTFRKVAPRLF